MFLQQLFNGLSVGSIYALMAVGYSLIYSLLNFTNFAHSLTVSYIRRICCILRYKHGASKLDGGHPCSGCGCGSSRDADSKDCL